MFKLFPKLATKARRTPITSEDNQMKYQQPQGQTAENNNYPNYQMPQSGSTPIIQTVPIKSAQPYVPPGQNSSLVQQDAQNTSRPEFRSVAPPQSPMNMVQSRPVESPKVTSETRTLKSSEGTQLQQAPEPLEVIKQTSISPNQSVPWRVQRSSQPITETVANRNNIQQVNKQPELQQKRQSQIETNPQEAINQSPKPVRKS